jgi:hypothetical protein
MHVIDIARCEEFVRRDVRLAVNTNRVEEVVKGLQQELIIVNYGDRGVGLETH